MKITDFCIIFALLVICFLTGIDVRQQLAYEKLYQNSRYNAIMDNAVENALRAAFENVDADGKPVVNLKTAADFLTDELSVMLSGKTFMSEYYADRLVCAVYTCDEGFYYTDLNENKEWSEIYKFSGGQTASHSDRVNEIQQFIYENYNVLLSIPSNDGESYENTIEDYTLMTIYYDYNEMCCFSAAAIKKRQE